MFLVFGKVEEPQGTLSEDCCMKSEGLARVAITEHHFRGSITESGVCQLDLEGKNEPILNAMCVCNSYIWHDILCKVPSRSRSSFWHDPISARTTDTKDSIGDAGRSIGRFWRGCDRAQRTKLGELI